MSEIYFKIASPSQGGGRLRRGMRYPHRRVLLVHENECSTDTSYNVDEPGQHYAKGKKARHKDSVPIKYPE